MPSTPRQGPIVSSKGVSGAGVIQRQPRQPVQSNPQRGVRRPAPAGTTLGPAGGSQGSDGLLMRLARHEKTAKGLLTQPFYFQCAPLEEMRQSFQYGHSEYDTVDADAFSRAGSNPLPVYAFRTMFVNYLPGYTSAGAFTPSWAQWYGDAPDPVGRYQELDAIGAAKTPVIVTMTPALARAIRAVELTDSVTLRSMDVTESAGEPDTRYLDLSFSRWRAVSDQRGQKRGRTKGVSGAGVIQKVTRGDTFSGGTAAP